MKKVSRLFALTCMLVLTLMPSMAVADDSAANDQHYYLGSTVNAGLDTGFSKTDSITKDDPHFGWNLGSFYVSGYTAVERSGENPTFLKTAGDTVALFFRLDQDINCLNGREQLSIAEDSDGYDERFGIPKTNFGRGALIVRQTNYENAQGEPQVYTNYLEANASQGANTQVDLFEEGDYEVTLDYEIIDNPRKVPLVNWSVLPGYNDYRMSFSFSVRNGNAMVFPFDVTTGAELTNSSATENGFYIDLAKSRYLTVNVKREVLADSGEGLVEDVRSNAPAEDGKEYTEEGIYTISATNPTTGQTTEKKIYVGKDGVLKAYVATGYSIDEIKNQVSQGALIDDSGNIVWPSSAQAPVSNNESATPSVTAQKEGNSYSWLIVVGAIAAVVVIAVALHKKKQRAGNAEVLNVENVTPVLQNANRAIGESEHTFEQEAADEGDER